MDKEKIHCSYKCRKQLSSYHYKKLKEELNELIHKYDVVRIVMVDKTYKDQGKQK